MALVTPSNLYSGAAQVFDTRSHIAFQQRLLAHHRAQQDALDAYYRKMPLSINEKGVRDQERPDIAKSMNDIKGFYIQNRDKLRKGDQEAAFNYEKMIRDHQDLVGRSASAGLTDTQVGKLRNNPKTMFLFQTSDIVKQLDSHHLPVNDPNHVDFDLESFTQPPKPLEKDKYMKRYDKVKSDDFKTVVSNKDGTQTITNTPNLGEDAKNNIMSGATWDYLHDPSVTAAVNQLGEADETNPLNPIFKKTFGRDIQNPIDLTAAFITANKLPTPTTEVIKPDQLAMTKQRQEEARRSQQRQFRHQELMQRNAQSYREATIDYKADKDVKANDDVLNKVINTSFDSGTTKIKGYPVDHITIDGTDYKGKFVDIPKSVALEYGQFKGKDKDGNDVWENPDAFYITDDKKKFIPVFLGKKTGTSENNYIKPESKPRDMQMYKLSLSKYILTKKDAGGNINNDDFTESTIDAEAPAGSSRTEIHKTTKSSSAPLTQTKSSKNKWDKYKVK